MSYRVEWMPFAVVMGLVTLSFVFYLGPPIALVIVVVAAAAAVALVGAVVAAPYLLGRSVLRRRRARTDPDRPRRPAFGRFAAIQPALERARREVPRSGVAPAGGPSPSSPGDPRRRIGARVRVSHLERPGHREELEGVVVGRQKYGVNVRLPDGTIRGFSDVEVSPAEPESPGEGDWLARISELFADTSLTPVPLRVRRSGSSLPASRPTRLPSADASGPQR